MADLFISYSSHDRPWAERLFNDLTFSYPTLKIFFDRDQQALPIGANWAEYLKDNARKATHFAVFWSEKAKESNQVGPEIQAFDQSRATTPTLNGATRQLFYIPLEGEYGPLEPLQGLAELRKRKLYSPAVADRGLSTLDNNLNRAEWTRIVRTIRDTALKVEGTVPINLALLVMNSDIADLVDPLENKKTNPAPPLGQFLQAYGLTLANAKQRYGRNAFAWRPFGNRTIIELMQELRETVNGNLDSSQYFHWVELDLYQIASESKSDTDFRNRLAAVLSGLSAVIVDPISLYCQPIGEIFKRLGEYAAREHSVIISIAPTETPALDVLHQSLRHYGSPVLDRFFLPQIPGSGAFARCCVNVEHMVDMERLVRGGLAIYALRGKETADKPLVNVGT